MRIARVRINNLEPRIVIVRINNIEPRIARVRINNLEPRIARVRINNFEPRIVRGRIKHLKERITRVGFKKIWINYCWRRIKKIVNFFLLNRRTTNCFNQFISRPKENFKILKLLSSLYIVSRSPVYAPTALNYTLADCGADFLGPKPDPKRKVRLGPALQP